MADQPLRFRRRDFHLRLQPRRLYGAQPGRADRQVRAAEGRRRSRRQANLQQISPHRGADDLGAVRCARQRPDRRPHARRAIDAQIFHGHPHQAGRRMGHGRRPRRTVAQLRGPALVAGAVHEHRAPPANRARLSCARHRRAPAGIFADAVDGETFQHAGSRCAAAAGAGERRAAVVCRRARQCRRRRRKRYPAANSAALDHEESFAARACVPRRRRPRRRRNHGGCDRFVPESSCMASIACSARRTIGRSVRRPSRSRTAPTAMSTRQSTHRCLHAGTTIRATGRRTWRNGPAVTR